MLVWELAIYEVRGFVMRSEVGDGTLEDAVMRIIRTSVT